MLLYRIFRAILIVLCKVFFSLEVKGREFIPKKGGFVLASNHTSLLDPILLGTACPRLLNFAAKDSLFHNSLFAMLISEVGAFPVKRWSADLSAIKESVRRLKKGMGLVVFPEGRRSRTIQMQDISYGFVLLAIKANVPVVPAWIRGSQIALGKGSKMIRPTKIKVVFGQPVYIERRQVYADVARDVYKQINLLACA